MEEKSPTCKRCKGCFSEEELNILKEFPDKLCQKCHDEIMKYMTTHWECLGCLYISRNEYDGTPIQKDNKCIRFGPNCKLP